MERQKGRQRKLKTHHKWMLSTLFGVLTAPLLVTTIDSLDHLGQSAAHAMRVRIEAL